MSQKVDRRRVMQVWPFFAFMGMGSSVSFIHAGVKHKIRNLVVFGVAYGLLTALAIAINYPTGGTAEKNSNTSTTIVLLVWVVSTTHAFRVNKKHRANALGISEMPGMPHTPPPVPPSASDDSFESLSSGYFASDKELNIRNDAVASAVPVDVNSADLQTLLGRLNLSPASAEQVLLARQSSGGFRKIEDFVRTAGLKPHEFAKIRNYVTITPIERENVPNQQADGRTSSGRRLDI